MTQPSISPGWCSCDQVGEVLAFTACPRLAAQPWPAGPYCVGGGQRWQCRGLPQPQLRAAVQPRRGPPAPAWWLWGVAAWPASGAKPDKKKSPSTHSPFFSLLLIDLAEEASATAALRMDASAAAAPDVTPEGATRQFQPVCHGCCTGAVPCRRPGGGCRHRIVCRACVHEEQAWQHGNTAHGSVCNAGWTNGGDQDEWQ